MRKKDIDNKDIELINILAEDASLNNREIARKLGISDSPTLVRYNNLLDKGVIKKIIALINEEYVGYDTKALGYVILTGPDLSKVKAEIIELPTVSRIWELETWSKTEKPGNAKLLFEISSKGNEQLLELRGLFIKHEVSVADYFIIKVKNVLKDRSLELSQSNSR